MIETNRFFSRKKMSMQLENDINQYIYNLFYCSARSMTLQDTLPPPSLDQNNKILASFCEMLGLH